MFNEALEIKKDQPSKFQGLTKEILEDSDMFRGDSLRLIEAIEKDKLPLYLGERPNDRKVEMTNYLKLVHEELKKAKPDYGLIDSTIDLLRSRLRI